MFSLFRKLPKAASVLALAGALFTLGAPAHASYVVVYDSLHSSTDGSDPTLSYVALANSFNTGANGAGVLDTLSLILTNNGTDVLGDIKVTLHADGPNGPGAELATLGQVSSSQVDTDFDILTFMPSFYFLSANTTYWVEITNLSPNALAWAWSTDSSGTGVAGQYSYSQILGKAANTDLGPYQMSVTVPEPASLALVALGLGGVVFIRRRKS